MKTKRKLVPKSVGSFSTTGDVNATTINNGHDSMSAENIVVPLYENPSSPAFQQPIAQTDIGQTSILGKRKLDYHFDTSLVANSGSRKRATDQSTVNVLAAVDNESLYEIPIHIAFRHQSSPTKDISRTAVHCRLIKDSVLSTPESNEITMCQPLLKTDSHVISSSVLCTEAFVNDVDQQISRIRVLQPVVI